MKRRWLACVIAILIAMAWVTAYASELVVPRYDYTSSVSASLSIDAGVARASGHVTPQGSNRTSVEVRLQRNDSGQWNTIATWRGSNSAGASSAGGYKNVASGNTYRTFTTGYVYNSDGVVIEVTSKKTPEKSY